MRGDFSRDSFDALGGFTRVLQQQGRIEIDADGNERQAIQLRLIRQLAADLIGPFGGPKGTFRLSEADGMTFDFAISPGSYYVDGWRIENVAPVYFRGDGKDRPAQPGFAAAQPKEGSHFVWLDVWERHVSALEHDSPLRANDPRRIAEVALAGQDTASRAQTVWAVRLSELSRDDAATLQQGGDWRVIMDRLQPPGRGLLAARAIDPAAAGSDDPCLVGPTSAYRGVENQLYRVEIWREGTAGDGASFVWSRENGSVLFAVEQVAGKRVRLAEGWHDARFGLGVGDIVSLEGSAQRHGAAASLFKVVQYDDEAIELELDGAPALDAAGGEVVLRRWDHRQRPASAGAGRLVDGALALVEDEWITLEDGISVRFPPSPENVPSRYRPGDHWLIPARTAIGDILWLQKGDEPAAVAPHGIERRFAPLGLIRFDAQGKFTLDLDLRKEFGPLAG
ncbi:DUF6519 domain-containing protein [Novosphingobium sp. 9U]|uniref:DUF6519 domain-containing protein n=1 Tax=Novosphingobium sp. 9U TaxID=2653158 RepID=UPI0012F147D3|nr:DUF6519 domain-containing protein [Novosphingobium sp. 9U]VWX50889.1 conserved hypothetical protein [Novosphingobium sp. 9U]